jgi:hypothetical protein
MASKKCKFGKTKLGACKKRPLKKRVKKSKKGWGLSYGY